MPPREEGRLSESNDPANLHAASSLLTAENNSTRDTSSRVDGAGTEDYIKSELIYPSKDGFSSSIKLTDWPDGRGGGRKLDPGLWKIPPRLLENPPRDLENYKICTNRANILS